MSLFNRAEVIDDNFISFLNEEKFPPNEKKEDSKPKTKKEETVKKAKSIFTKIKKLATKKSI